MASNADRAPIPPACPPIQEPGPPLRIGGDGHNVSTKVDPNRVVKQDPRLPDGGGRPNF
jgi:hypothetical protein